MNKTVDIRVNQEELNLIVDALLLLKNSQPRSFSTDRLFIDMSIYPSSQLKRLEFLNEDKKNETK